MANKLTEAQQKNLIKQKQELVKELGLVVPKNIGDRVINSITTLLENGTLHIPQGYSPGNAVKLAYLKIVSDPKLMATNDISKANALLQMVTLGLSVAKTQCYMIPYGNECTLSLSYFGKVTVAKRMKGVINVIADVIYEATEYELLVNDYGETDIRIIKPAGLNDRDSEKIIGAWCRVILDPNVFGSESYTVVMNMKQIRAAWNMGATKGNSPAHKNFADEMAKKSVINRAAKWFTNTGDDSDLFIGTFNEVISKEDGDVSPNVENETYEEVYEAKVIEAPIIEELENKKIENETPQVEAEEQGFAEFIQEQQAEEMSVDDLESLR